MTKTNEVVVQDKQTPIMLVAARYNIDPAELQKTLKGTVVPNGTTDAEFQAFLMVAFEYKLNPILKEIYAFPKKGGGIQTIVAIDGWMNIINSHPQFDGMTFQENFGPDGKVESITAKIFRKDRAHSVDVTEYLSECFRPTEPWKQWPIRMLRHKTAIQAARYAFGFSGIMEPDEAERMVDVSPQQRVPDGPAKLVAAVEQRRAAEMIRGPRTEEALVVDVSGFSESIASPGLSPLPAEKLSVGGKALPKAPAATVEPETKPAGGHLSETVFAPPAVLKRPDGTEFTFGVGGEVSEHELVEMIKGYNNSEKESFVTKNDDNLIAILGRLRGAGLAKAAESIKAMRDRIQEDGGLI